MLTGRPFYLALVAESNALAVEVVPLASPGPDGIVGDEGWEGEGEVRLLKIVAGE